MKIALITTDNREHYKRYEEVVPQFGTAPEALLQGFSKMKDVEVHVLSCSQQSLKSPVKLAENVFFHGLHVPKIGWMRTCYSGCIRAVRGRLRQIQPDIVHGQGTERECSISAVFSGFPNVLTIHGNMRLIAQVNKSPAFSFNWLAGKLEKATIPRSAGVVCITRYTQEAVASLARKTWVVPNAVDETFFGVESETDDSSTVLCVGNISLRKNQNAFIRALDSLATTKKFKVLFLGQAQRGMEYVDEFFKLVKTRQWCVYGGFADREKLKELLKTAELLVLPSLEDNCPMVVLEAMAAGVPVLAAKVGGLPDLITNGKNGWFCDPLDSGSMRDGVEKMLTDLPAARALAATAKQMAHDRFHPTMIARRHVEIYREVLSKDS